MRLRRQLGAIDGSLPARLVTFRGGGGYALEIRPEELDLHRFRGLWTAGRDALRADEFTEAQVALSEAVSLWRGNAGIDTPPDGLLSNLLEAQNQDLLAANDDLAAARVASGLPEVALPSLRLQFLRYPIRERSAELLLIANYRLGHIPAALAVYQHMRAVLRAELNVSPGEKVRRLHQFILERNDAVIFDNNFLISELFMHEGSTLNTIPAVR